MKKTAIVTGGAQGIGRAITKLLLERGMHVVVADCDTRAGRECVREYRNLGGVHFIRTDVSSEQSVRNCVAGTLRRWGRIDALVNNAGITAGFGVDVERLTRARWDRVIGVNLTGMFLMAKHATRYLRKSHGSMVNIASTRALQSEARTEAYAASKGGIVALTHALALSLGPAVRVNCISPGWIETAGWEKKKARSVPHHSTADRLQHPAGRVGVPFDIAAMVAYLISKDAGFITGQNFVVDGGMTKKMIYG